MAKLLEPKVQATGLFDAFEMGVLKTLTERIATPIVGNSTIMSGGAKLLTGGIVAGASRNKHVGLLSSAMVIDGVEDMAHALVGRFLGGNAGASGATAWNQ